MTPTAAPLLELLRDATARGRPALTLTFARVAEVLGEMPDTSWWYEQRGPLRSAGYAAVIDRERQWVTFERTPATEQAAEHPGVDVDVRVTFTWTGHGAEDATAWVGDRPVAVDLSPESARNLAEASGR